MAIEEAPTTADTGRRRRQRRRRRTRRPPASRSSNAAAAAATDSDSDSDHTWHSPEGEVFDEIDERDCVDLERGDLELKARAEKKECRDCRICHLRLVGESGDRESGSAIELGCSCKGDLAAAHKQCAETWFKIRGNTTCEICGATALNVVGDQTIDANVATMAASAATSAPPTLVTLAETQNFWHGRRLMNILLGCMVFAFIISWLFHFNLLSHHQ